MPGIYIHIPFCKQACHYCNFHFSVSQKRKPEFLQALVKEICLQKDFFTPDSSQKTNLDTLYIGGGTPSILSLPEINRIFAEIRKYFELQEEAEITLEANPDDLTPEKISALSQTPINRLSIGIQSFQANNLKYMNRSHTPNQALDALQNAKKEGFKNLTADLIYGTPGMSDKQWADNILQLIKLEVPHISAYSLTVEKKTALDVFIRKGIAKPVEEEQAARQFDILREITSNYGYEHYEISNFALPGYYSRHNMSYWTGEPYLGLGPSAHSFLPSKRIWNIANTNTYIDEIFKGTIPCEEELLSTEQQYNEYIMTALRTMWGIEKKHVEENFGKNYLEKLMKSSQKHLKNQNLEDTGTHILVSIKGKFFSDGIAADLFLV